MSARSPAKPPWAPPTRRAFVAMLASAAAVALAPKLPRAERAAVKRKPIWIGHC